MAELMEPITLELNAPTPELTAAPDDQPVAEQPARPVNHHALAGRKGAERIHQLIERGKLYEQEHDLKRGRQRLRQLIEEGKRYEQEHGLSPRRRRKREAHVTQEQVVRRLFDALVRIAKPSYRPGLLKMVQALETAPE